MRKSRNSPYQVGPLYLIRRGGTFHIYGTHSGQRIRAAAGTDDLRMAKTALDTLLSELESGWRIEQNCAETSWPAVAKWVCTRHRFSAKERGIPFMISAHDVFDAMKQTGFCCAVSGIPFSRRVGPNGQPDPWSASIDRIEGRHGYLRDNIRVVSLAANLAMNRWGYDVLLRLSRSVVRSANQVLCHENVTQNPPSASLNGGQAIEPVELLEAG